MDASKNKLDASVQLKKLQDEENELVAAVAKLKCIKNKLKVEELTLTAELRQRSMEAARALSTAGADRSGAAAAAPGRRPPPLLLDVASVSGCQLEEEDEDEEMT
ncbi:uncharacterized protein LOC122379415 [Amphibalanus amphitrite]|uniref:uncharacterized protein LOC122379415 n=1 Tax=Amphibalanus amphitrite TaxID=1232801 RepID=UPI001C921231|nr:uncharacterized protein LOC122379415 [Amphibalanus amphitrite]XP_043217564.1 uncharacterized protein LOC122379415 [Amphibalanus amphitrite]XP_043217565.1 uncharacterized protein LOC122379415 [Amphibalanus amphitrite]XP_043217566.1 uncharacterized protein LOC122379415 [Amphibalanus amphitrite]XP_043217567.1 uncharacterized protein LOC122379415 [Amphibalanus amphitrite]